MALIRDGGLVAGLSGRVGGVVAARNRGGSYLRAGTNPITTYTTYSINAKAILANVSQSWGSLTAAQRAAWNEWAAGQVHFNRIGQSITLNGQPAFIGLNSRLAHIPATQLTDPPVAEPPAGLTSLALTADIGTGNFEFTFAGTPLAANTRLWILAAVVDSPAIQNVQSLLRYVGTSAAAQASPFDPQSLIEARFGTLVVGQRITCYVNTIDTSTGLVSRPLRVDATVISSP